MARGRLRTVADMFRPIADVFRPPEDLFRRLAAQLRPFVTPL